MTNKEFGVGYSGSSNTGKEFHYGLGRGGFEEAILALKGRKTVPTSDHHGLGGSGASKSYNENHFGLGSSGYVS